MLELCMALKRRSLLPRILQGSVRQSSTRSAPGTTATMPIGFLRRSLRPKVILTPVLKYWQEGSCRSGGHVQRSQGPKHSSNERLKHMRLNTKTWKVSGQSGTSPMQLKRKEFLTPGLQSSPIRPLRNTISYGTKASFRLDPQDCSLRLPCGMVWA